MGEVIKFKWIVNLLTSDFIDKPIKKYIFGNKPGCKKDFEMVAQAPKNNIEFTKWFNSMVEKGVFKIYQVKNLNRRNSKNIKTYTIIEPKLWAELKKNNFYEKIKEAFKNKDRFIEVEG